MTRVDKIAEVRKLRFNESLPIREITRIVKLSRPTVQKIIRSGLTKFTYQRNNQPHPATGNVRDLIKLWLEEDRAIKRKQQRTAFRMYDILKSEHGYTGSYESIARCVRELKGEITLENKEAYIPLSFGAGEAFQFDWGEAKAYIRKELVNVNVAVTQLCHSRHFYPVGYPCQKQELMLDAHRRAFEYFGGTCKRGIYDNLRSAVKELLKGHHRNLQEKFVRFSSHYMYEPEFCNPARGNEKGRVENLIGVIERNFFAPIPHFDSIDELNSRMFSFAVSHSRMKEHPEIAGKSRYEVFEEEQKVLVGLPYYGFECCKEKLAVVSPYCVTFYDNNYYSVPHEYVGRIVLVKGYSDEVAISYCGYEIARHRRSYGLKQYILEPIHYLRLLARKPGALRDGLPFKNWHLPEVFYLYRDLLKEKYDDGDRYYAKVLTLLCDWPLKEVTEAIEKAIRLGIYGDSGILMLLRHGNELPPPTEYIDILIRVELSRYSAKQRPLSDYDELLRLNQKGGETVWPKLEEKKQ